MSRQGARAAPRLSPRRTGELLQRPSLSSPEPRLLSTLGCLLGKITGPCPDQTETPPTLGPDGREARIRPCRLSASPLGSAIPPPCSPLGAYWAHSWASFSGCGGNPEKRFPGGGGSRAVSSSL